MKASKKLNYEERHQLYRLYGLGCTLRQIGKQLNRNVSTISREIKRNGVKRNTEKSYYQYAREAQESFIARRRESSRRKMRLDCPVIQDYVVLHLVEAGWSPEIIAGRLKRHNLLVSYESIYQWINHKRPDLKQYLKVAGRSRRRRRAEKRPRKVPQAAAIKRSIEILPIEAKTRTEIGHFEIDAVEGIKGGKVLQNITDRKSRKVFLTKVASLKSAEYSEVVSQRLQIVPEQVRHTMLLDNGAENSNHAFLDKTLNMTSYFCHPYCSSEKGTVENRNRIIRRFIAKHTDFEFIPEDWIQYIEDVINNTPLKILGFKTPQEVWNEEIAKLKIAA